MPRVRIRTLGELPGGAPSPQKKQHLIQLLTTLKIFFIRIIKTDDSYIVLTDTDDECNIIFEDKGRDLLQAQGFDPVLSPERRAKMTVVLKGVDESILEESKENILQNLSQTAPYAKIDDIYVLARANLIKLRMTHAHMATRMKKEGVKLLCFSIPPRNVEFERYTAVSQCTHCSLYSHVKATCPNLDKLFCSECSAEDHMWRRCPNKNNPKCRVCGGPHRSMSGKCETRKALIKDINKKKEEKVFEKENKTYREVARQAVAATATITNEAIKNTVKTATQEATQARQILQLPNDISLKMLMIVIHAHQANIANPGSYEEEVLKAQRLNNLPEVKLGEVNYSHAVFGVRAP